MTELDKHYHKQRLVSVMLIAQEELNVSKPETEERLSKQKFSKLGKNYRNMLKHIRANTGEGLNAIQERHRLVIDGIEEL